jgi:hypothetical protein
MNIMPGILPHLIVGCTIFIIGRFYYYDYFKGDNKTKELIILAIICISFSFIPDIYLGLHYTTHIISRKTAMPYHVSTQAALFPIAIVALIIIYFTNLKRKPIFVMGFWAIILHIIMDSFINTEGLLI